MRYAMRRTPRTPSSGPSGRRPPGTVIIGESAPNGKGIMGQVGSLRVHDLAPAGLISMAFDVSVVSCVKRRNQLAANGTGRIPTEIGTVPSMTPERGRHGRGRSGR